MSTALAAAAAAAAAADSLLKLFRKAKVLHLGKKNARKLLDHEENSLTSRCVT